MCSRKVNCVKVTFFIVIAFWLIGVMMAISYIAGAFD